MKVTPRTVLLAIGVMLFIGMIIGLTTGVVQNYYVDHQYDQCKKIDTGTNYKGYDCGKDTIYIPKQQ